jgi:hypothetical protein
MLQCRTQFSFAGGSAMCTTCCTCVGMAFVKGSLQLPTQWGGVWGTHDTIERVDHLMTLCARIQRKAEQTICDRDHGGVHRPMNMHLCDLVQHTNMDISRFGIGVKEFVVVHGSQLQHLNLSDTDSCCISFADITTDRCMPLPPQDFTDSQKKCISAGVVTAREHSVCVARYLHEDGDVRYAWFDPASGQLQYDLCGATLLRRVAANRMISYDPVSGNLNGRDATQQMDLTVFGMI